MEPHCLSAALGACDRGLTSHSPIKVSLATVIPELHGRNCHAGSPGLTAHPPARRERGRRCAVTPGTRRRPRGPASRLPRLSSLTPLTFARPLTTRLATDCLRR